MRKYSSHKTVEYKPLGAKNPAPATSRSLWRLPFGAIGRATLALVFALPALALFTSCADKSITPIGFRSEKQLRAGEMDTIRWNFKNATKVNVSGLKKDFLPKDSLVINPNTDAELTITAINKYFDDTLKLKYRIELIPNSAEKPMASVAKQSEPEPPRQEIQSDTTPPVARPENAKLPIRGPEAPIERKLGKSTRESEFFVGLAAKQSQAEPYKLKVMRVEYPASAQDAFKLRAILLDANGNFIPNANAMQGGKRWIIDQICESDKLTYSYALAPEHGQSNIEDLEIAIVEETSFAAEQSSEVRSAIELFIPTLDPNDKVMYGIFNQNFHVSVPLSAPNEAQALLQKTAAVAPSGSCSAHKALYATLKALSEGKSKSKAVVLISYTPDNSSLLYTYNDVAELARKSGIPIYVIGIGNSVSTYANRMLAGLAEGRSYWISDDEANQLPDILSEIANSQKYYYELAFPISSMLENCKTPANSLTFEHGRGTISERISLFPTFSTAYYPYQAIALFDEKSSVVSADYDENLKLLAETLIDNPTVGIALAGHAATEGDENYCESIAYDRAEAVRLKLIDLGVDEKQIRTRSFGAQKRLFMNEDREWKRAFSRRVELRWLDPSTLPWEIIASSESNEETAQSKVDFWESKGRKAYFDRYIKSDNSIYKVKIWGFPTYEDARKAQKKLEKDYKKKFVIE